MWLRLEHRSKFLRCFSLSEMDHFHGAELSAGTECEDAINYLQIAFTPLKF